MRPEFAKAVDPIFEHVLRLLDRIDQNELVSPEEEMHRVKAMVDRADATMGAGREWQLAKAGLIYWIDEVLIQAPWEGRNFWYEACLERQYFNKRDAARDYFVDAKEASGSPQRDALEVFYIGVILGFRGLYDDPEKWYDLIQQFELPDSLQEWVKQTAQAIRSRPKPPITPTRNFGHGAPPLTGQGMFALAMAALAVVSAVTLITGWVVYFVAQ